MSSQKNSLKEEPSSSDYTHRTPKTLSHSLNKERKTQSPLKPENSSSSISNYRKRLFGTDGIRGTAGVYPITPEIILKVGQAFGYVLSQNQDQPRVVIGKDTRLSGYMVEQCLAAGLNSMGVNVQLVGPLPTPGIGFLAANMRADAGIVISASHNPYQDNGIKIFGPDGYKISDRMEQDIEFLVLDQDMTSFLKSHEKIGRTRRIDDALGRYLVFVKNVFPLNLNLENLRIVLDCAHGSAYKVAPLVFRELGAEVITLGDQPDGFNINDKTGALYPEQVSEAVKTYRADVGICLDGDADRVVLVDENGQIINGDRILAICALLLQKERHLRNNSIVVTHMSNIGLDQFLKSQGINVCRVGVGDKYVMESMREKGFSLGGEQSGHIIFLDYSTTGDGLIAALKVLEASKKMSKKLSELRNLIKDSPSVLKNIQVSQKVPLEQIPGYFEMISEVEKSLGNSGRIFIRYSGTEPVLRILVEASNKVQAQASIEHIEKWLQENLEISI